MSNNGENKKPIFMQLLMDKAHKRWRGNRWTVAEFVDQLDGIERAAVVWGHLNYQVTNGGFRQWCDNEYVTNGDVTSRMLRHLLKWLRQSEAGKSVCQDGDVEVVNSIRDMVGQVRSIWDRIEDNKYRDDDTVLCLYEHMDQFDDRFYEINERFLHLCECYLTSRFVEGD